MGDVRCAKNNLVRGGGSTHRDSIGTLVGAERFERALAPWTVLQMGHQSGAFLAGYLIVEK
jgi:hypothetical protein